MHHYFYYDFTDEETETERVCHVRDVIPLESGGLTRESSRKTSTSASLTMLKSLTVWITTNCGKFLKSWEYSTTLSASRETCMQVKKQQLEPDMEKWTGSKLGKGYKAVYCHPAF